MTVDAMLLSHPGNCLGYRFDHNGRRVCFITDNELFDKDSEYRNADYVERLAALCYGADLLITDTTYTDASYPRAVGDTIRLTREDVRPLAPDEQPTMMMEPAITRPTEA